MIKNSIVVAVLLIAGCSDTNILNIEPNITVKSPKNLFVARAYVNLWGGAAGGVDYIINIQPNSEKSLFSKNIIFKTSKEGKICIDWIDEKNIKISTAINKNISIKEKTIVIGNKKINVLFSSKIHSDNCMRIQGLESKIIIPSK